MTTEEKAKAYNDIIQRVTELYETKTVLTTEQMEHLFPELRESDDEKIRKGLLTAFQKMNGWWNGMLVSGILAWLEKQKENPKSADSIPSNCTANAKCEDRWHKVTDSLPDNPREVLCKDEAGNYFIGRYYVGEGWEISNYDDEDKPHHLNPPVSKWIDFPSEKQKETLHISKSCKENADSFISEDERIRHALIEFLREAYRRGNAPEECAKWIVWLDQPKEQESLTFNEHYNPDDYEVVMEGNATSLKRKIKDVVKDITKNKESAIKFLKSAGIMDDNGELAEMYRSEQKPAEDTFQQELEATDKWQEGYEAGYNAASKPTKWSEDDEKNLKQCIEIVRGWEIDYDYANPHYSNWLKSLRPQPKQEWSEEEIGHLYTLARYIKSKGYEDDGEFLEGVANKLKSLRPQSHKEIYQAAKHDLAIRFMNYLDENKPEGKMSLSNSECEDIDKAFKENDWAKIMRYVEKYRNSWKPSKEQNGGVGVCSETI